jgi:hypothetical protein
MVHQTIIAALVSGALAVAGAGEARAATSDAALPLDEHSALLVGEGNLKLGILSFDYGLTRDVSIGSDSLAWFAGAVSPVFAPNLHLKVAFVQRPGFVASVQLAGYYVNLTSRSEASGRLVTVPATVYLSGRVLPRLWLHGEGNYNWVRGFGAGNIDRGEVNGAVAHRNAQLGLMVEYRLSRVVGLIARGRVQVSSTPLVLHGNSDLDPFTHAELGAELRPVEPHPWMAVAGVALTWTHVAVVAGAGYGFLFIPGANLALPGRGFVPEASFWVAF